MRYIDVQSSVIDAVFVADSPGEHRDVALADTAAEDPWADVPRVNTLLIGLRRRQGPLGHPHRLDDGGQHQHQDR